MRYPGFVGGSYQSQSVIADCEETINWYVERLEAPNAKAPTALYPTPGFSPFVRVSQTNSRGGIFAANRFFQVVGPTLYEINADGSAPTVRGTVGQDTNPATLAYNGVSGGQIFITSAGNGFCFALASNTLTQVLTGDALQGGFAHGYFLAFSPTNGRVRLSALNDGTSWPAAAWFGRSLFSDPWQAMVIDGNSLIWLLGTESFEVWYDSGASPQPFAPLSGMVGPYGIAAPFAACLAGPQLIWPARNKDGAGMIVSARGGTANRVSTYAIETALSGYQRTSTIGDSEAFVYQQEGHEFYILNFPTANVTHALDVDAQSWARRGRWRGNQYDLWTPRVHVSAWGKHYIGDRTSGVIATMDVQTCTEIDGTGIRRLRRAPGLTMEHRRIPYDRLELLMETGVGLTTGQGSDPQITLRCSDDGGKTWGAERSAGLGRIGQTRRRVYWTRLGTSADRVFEVVVSDPVPSRIIDAWVNNES